MVNSVLSGLVVKSVSDKTIKVSVESVFMHPFYHKVIRSRKNYLVHDEMNKMQEGDSVSFALCKPFSLRKKWKVLY